MPASRAQWPPALLEAVAALRADNPMWGKRKIAVLPKREGVTTSVSTVGRIHAHLVKRGAVLPAPLLRRGPGARRIRLAQTQRYAKRIPKGRRAEFPGELVQIDTLFVNVRPTRPSSSSPPTIPSPSGLSAASRRKPPPTRLRPSSTNSSPKRPSPCAKSRSTAAPNSSPSSKPNVWRAASNSSCRRQTARPRRMRRARPIEPAIRVLRHLRPAATHRQAANPRRRLRPPLQSVQAPPRPWRPNPARVSPCPQPRGPPVSYEVNPDTVLTK